MLDLYEWGVHRVSLALLIPVSAYLTYHFRKHWLKSNLERLSLTFRRPVIGVHNRTNGIIFDLMQCIVERNFCYATADVRNAYALIKDRLIAEKHKKVVLILHSQGGIEGGLILDWLLSER